MRSLNGCSNRQSHRGHKIQTNQVFDSNIFREELEQRENQNDETHNSEYQQRLNTQAQKVEPTSKQSTENSQ